MAETGTMSEQKRLGIAWGTTFAMVFSAVVAANVGGAAEPAEAEAVLAAHKNFEESIATPIVEEKTTSLKPAFEEADEKPELEQTYGSETQATISDIPITTPVEEVEIESAAASTVTVIEPETPSESVSADAPVEELSATATDPVPAEAPEATIPQDVEVTQTELNSTEVDEIAASEVVDLDVPSEVEPVQEVEIAASAPDLPAVTKEVASDVAEVEDAVELAVVSQADEPAAIDVAVSDGVLDDLPSVEAESPAADVIEEESAVAVVAPPVATISSDDEKEIENSEATSLEPNSSEQTESDTIATFAADPVAAEAPKSKATGKPFFGVGIRNAANSVVTTIYDGSTAQSLGMKLGDQLISVNGQPVANVDGLRAVLKGLKVNTPTSVKVERAGTRYQLGPKPLGAR